MDQVQGNPKLEPILFSNNGEHGNEILNRGIEATAVITYCNEESDPRDDEHHIFHLGFDYVVGPRVFHNEVRFSINVAHIVYGFNGGLINTPKFKYSLDDFKNSMRPGKTLKVTVLEDQPEDYVLEVNEVMAEIMRHDAVWR
jgi:hypothetical protein